MKPKIELPDNPDMPNVRSLSDDELDKIDYDTLIWECCVNGCTGHTKIRDYGVSPVFYQRRGKTGKWLKLTYWVWYCGKHSKLYKSYLKTSTPEKYFSPPEGLKEGTGTDHIKPYTPKQPKKGSKKRLF